MGLSNVVDLVGGGFHACALIEGGTVQCWGDNLRISSGWSHFCASDANWLECIGGPIEARGRLRYIDGCSNTFVVCPPRLGKPQTATLVRRMAITRCEIARFCSVAVNHVSCALVRRDAVRTCASMPEGVALSGRSPTFWSNSFAIV
ncbi:MAG TPA: RCC1 domain-containing protein [Polyangiaceae bacterium]